MYIKKAFELAASSQMFSTGGNAQGVMEVPVSADVGNVSFYFDAAFAELEQLVPKEKMVIITDENIYSLHKEKFAGIRSIKINSGEQHKNQQTVDAIVEQLIRFEAGKDTVLVGVGGGVVTDITGYVATVYMRGISFGLVPTSILCMVDAAIGGKNGIDVGVYKNMVGSIRQPVFIFYDYSFLKTLPVEQWVNGFAEIIKHACIRDLTMFQTLERYSLHDFQTDETLIAELIEKNVVIKAGIVARDEFEKGERKLLNFGHTIGHAIENLYQLPHGHAISIGMVAASNLSERLKGLHFDDAKKLIMLLTKYHLPVDLEVDHDKVFEVLKLDKKRVGDTMHFILIDKIGNGVIHPIPLDELQAHLKQII
ncbi:MAG TPA: 3-dehydroquinate synthase, partial [Ferruginibacter sp.]|nr:3-dehydroquinate synthase [Ferruginibacter sp.]